MSTKALEAVIDEFADMIGTSQSEMGLAATKEMVALKKAIKAALRHIAGDATITDKDMAVLRAAVGGGE